MYHKTNESIYMNSSLSDCMHTYGISKDIYNSNVVALYSWFVIGQCCIFQGINSMVVIS